MVMIQMVINQEKYAFINGMVVMHGHNAVLILMVKHRETIQVILCLFQTTEQ